MKQIVWILTLLLLGTSCTKEIEKIITPPLAQGSLVGIVEQNESGAMVYVRQTDVVDSTEIDPADGAFRIDDLSVGNYDVLVKANHYGSYWIRHVDIQAGGVTYLGEISLSDVPDLVASHYPEDQSEVVFDRRWSRLSVSVSFTTPMDRESVEAAFSTDPPSEGTFSWGSFASDPTPVYFAEDTWGSAERNTGAEITTYTKIQSFTYRMARRDCYTDTTYTVTLSTAAMDTAGNTLEFPLNFEFSTVQSSSSQNTILTQPEHGDIFVDPLSNASIYITFPRRMEASSVENAITISPDTDAIYVWPEMNQLRIYTGGPLRCNQLYEFFIDSTAEDMDGIRMGEPFTFSFETAPVEIESTSPQNGEVFVNTDEEVAFRFNTYMIISSIQEAFTITPAVSGTFQRGYGRYSNDSKDAVTFFPSGAFKVNTKYTVTLTTDAEDLHGTHLPEDYTFSFVTEPE
ncbi:Ig-like domain-containing protein [bacterium]|nr:Ig-like domain-containing protein [bacterium]